MASETITDTSPVQDLAAELQIPFYFGRGIIPKVERLFTRQRFEAISRDPGHVGCIAGETFFEAVWPHVRSGTVADALAQDDLYCVVRVAIPTERLVAAKAFLALQVGKHYSLRAIGLDLIGWAWPDYAARHKARFCLHGDEWTCSALVYAVLKDVAGVALPEVDEPVDPNRLLDWLGIMGFPVEYVAHSNQA